MSPLRVVVADDSEVYRKALCNFLQQVPDIEITAIARDGVEALKLVQVEKPDALLLDIEMPNMNGWEVMEELQADPSPPQVLIISSHAVPAIRQLVLDMGACGYVNKGNPRQIIDTIYEMIEPQSVRNNDRYH
jgi:DNA-binding NarL/FixJ family response regulator